METEKERRCKAKEKIQTIEFKLKKKKINKTLFSYLLTPFISNSPNFTFCTSVRTDNHCKLAKSRVVIKNAKEKNQPEIENQLSN